MVVGRARRAERMKQKARAWVQARHQSGSGGVQAQIRTSSACCAAVQVKCSECGYESNTYDPCIDLSLEITRAPSVRRALERFTAGEPRGWRQAAQAAGRRGQRRAAFCRRACCAAGRLRRLALLPWTLRVVTWPCRPPLRRRRGAGRAEQVQVP